MASTITLAGTIAATEPMLGYRPLNFPNLSPAIWEPAVTMANIVKMTMLGPPFGWRWNRLQTLTTFTCDPSQAVPTDYQVTGLSAFGWIEWATVNDLDPNNPIWRPMTKVEALGIAAEEELPRFIAAQYDDGAGDITFRVMPTPDQAYPVQMDIQQKCTLFTQAAPTQTWSPIPDEYSDGYTWGFQALALALNGDPRFGEFNQKFVNWLLARHSGLSETQISDFLNVWQATSGGQDQLIEKLRQGIQARGI